MSDKSSHSFGSAGEMLRHALAEMEARYEKAGSACIGDLLRPLGSRSNALGAALLALPFLSPFSLGPITTPASLVIAILGLGLLRRREARISDRLLEVSVPRAIHKIMHRALHRLSGWTDRARNARPSRWVQGTTGQRLCGAGVLAGAALLAVPVPLLPLTNTFPALAIILFVLGWANQDIRLTGFGAGALVLSTMVFAGLGIAVATLGWTAVQGMVPFL